MLGWRNISKIQLAPDNRIISADWGIEIGTKKVIPENFNYIAIPSNSFQIVSELGPNTIECRIINIIEEINKYVIVFENKNSGEGNYSPLYFSIDKENWHNRANKDRLYLKVNDGSFYLLTK